MVGGGGSFVEGEVEAITRCQKRVIEGEREGDVRDLIRVLAIAGTLEGPGEGGGGCEEGEKGGGGGELHFDGWDDSCDLLFAREVG